MRLFRPYIEAWATLTRECAGPHQPKPCAAGLIGGTLLLALVFIIIAALPVAFGGFHV